MGHLAYLGVLAFCVVGTAWLEVFLRTRVYRRWRRLLLVLLPVVVVFCLWDLYAIARGHWTFDPDLTTGLLLPGDLPLDEVMFFVVIPIASILTLEAVRSAKPMWDAGDGDDGSGGST